MTGKTWDRERKFLCRTGNTTELMTVPWNTTPKVDGTIVSEVTTHLHALSGHEEEL